MKKQLKIFSFILAVFLTLGALIGSFTFLKPQVPKLSANDTGINSVNIEDMPVVTDVKRFSDANKKNIEERQVKVNATPRTGLTSTPKPPKPLPYPRISINYSVQKTNSIRGFSVSNSSFLIVTLDIRNFGYKYFDAHPTKFKIDSGGGIEPFVNVSTGNMLDEVIPNNSRTKGDLVFLLKKGDSFSRNIKYISQDYTIIYRHTSVDEMNQEEEKAVEETPIPEDE